MFDTQIFDFISFVLIYAIIQLYYKFKVFKSMTFKDHFDLNDYHSICFFLHLENY